MALTKKDLIDHRALIVQELEAIDVLLKYWDDTHEYPFPQEDLPAKKRRKPRGLPGSLYASSIAKVPRSELQKAYFEERLCYQACSDRFRVSIPTLKKLFVYYEMNPDDLPEIAPVPPVQPVIEPKPKAKVDLSKIPAPLPKKAVSIATFQQAPMGKTEKLLEDILKRNAQFVD